MPKLDYSKWDKIEISDDEDDTHPNIDTPSLFRWRHQARLDRMAEAEKEKKDVATNLQHYQEQRANIKQKIKEAELKCMTDELQKLKADEAEIDRQAKEYEEKEELLKKKERLTPWNVDTICHDGKSKTIINKDIKPEEKELTDDERVERQKIHEEKYKKDIRKFGMLKRYEDSQEFLCSNIHLVCEETANYLILWCIDLAVEEKKDLMKHVSHQAIVLNFILELGRSLKVDPKSCVPAFFSRLKIGEKSYMDAFNDELESFRVRVGERAEARIERYRQEIEEEERKERLGPGGLDPVEVFETLPDILKECFEKKDVPMLEKAISEMDPKDAEYHMKRCVDSGLWVPGPNDSTEKVISSDVDKLENEEAATTYEEVEKLNK